MPCSGGCGGKKRSGNVGARIFDPTREPLPKRNERNMYLLAGDDPTEAQYHGSFPGSTILLVGYQTEHERIYLYSQRQEALTYASEHKVGMWRVSVVLFVHSRIVTLFGA
jgi:hypothetical protein